MDGTLFVVRSKAKARAEEHVSALGLTKDEVGGYVHSDADTLIIQIERFLEDQVFEETEDGMKGMASDQPNVLTRFKATVAIKKKDVLKASKDAATAASTNENQVEPEITTNSDAQEEADRQNLFRLAAIGYKEGIAAGITALIGKDKTNNILRSTDGRDFKSVDQYHLHQLIAAIRDGAVRPSAEKTRTTFVKLAGKKFNWRESAETNVERLATEAAKSQGAGIKMGTDLKAAIILANVEWAAKQEWGQDVNTAQRAIAAQYSYDFKHDDASIAAIMGMLAVADTARDRTKASEPEEVANSASGLTQLQMLIQQGGAETSEEESIAESAYYTATPSERGRGRKKERRPERKSSTRRRSPSTSPSRSPSSSRSPTPDRRERKSGYRARNKTGDRGEKNATKCPHCEKYKGNGYAHGPPANIPHDKCRFNKKFKGWRPEWVCKKMDVPYKTGAEVEEQE